MSKHYWLIKSEPQVYSWQKFVTEKEGIWDGVRNYQARNNLRAMRQGDLALFYHSNQGQCIVGVAKVSREHYPDPTTKDERWSTVNFVPVQEFARAVCLAEVKAEPSLSEIALVKQSRLSVMPLDARSFAKLLKMGQCDLKL